MRRLITSVSALALVLAVPATVLAAPPANDLPDGAFVQATLPATIEQDTTEATVSTDDFGCGTGGLDQATVWYTFTPEADVAVLFDPSGSSYAVGINVFEGAPTADGPFACLEGGVVELSAGTTYYLMFADIDGDGTNGGALSVALSEAPPPIEITLTVDGVGKVNQRTGSAVLTGTIACSREAETAFIDASVTQRVGRFTIRAFGFADTTCGPEPTNWSVDVQGDNGRLGGGRATVTLLAVACDAFQCSETQQTASVRLRR